MNEINPMKIICHKWPIHSLKTRALHTVSQMLYHLNDNMGSSIPWLTIEDNPFIGFSPIIIEEIINRLKRPLPVKHKNIRKELLQILLCKPMKKINLSSIQVEIDDVLHILETIKATKSDLTWLDIQFITESLFNSIRWSKIPLALNCLKEYIKTLPSLTYLNLSSACDDEMLEIIGTSCPNLIILEIKSDEFTSEGLKRLCVNRKDQTRQCQKLQKVKMGSSQNDEELMEGVEALLMFLPKLFILDWSHQLLGEILIKIYDQETELPIFQLRELCYFGDFHYALLPPVINKTCPFLASLDIWGASNEELQQFETLEHLKTLFISNGLELANFKDGVATFLQNSGKNLECLKLLGVNEIDFNVIDENCPNLRQLECSSGLKIFLSKVSAKVKFKNLEDLCLNSASCSGLQTNDCVCLLSRCFNLRSLILNCCDGLDRNNLKTILSANPLTSLRCVNISSESLFIKATSSEWKALLK